MTDKQIIDRVNVKECKYYCNGKCERYEEFVEADYANYSVKCICEKENDLGTYDICDYQQLKRKEQECEELKKANDEKNELLIKLGCPTTATAKRKVLYLEKELEKIKEINNEIKTDLKNWDERFKLQNTFIDNLLKATNNSIWIDKSISDEEASEIIEKIEMDYIEFEEGKEIYAELKAENEKLKQTLAEIKEIAEEKAKVNDWLALDILQKINECEINNEC